MREWISMVLRRLRSDREFSRPRPRVTLGLHNPVPVWVLKAAAGLAAAGCLILAFPGPLMWLLGGIVVFLILISRQPVAPQLLILLAGFSLLGGEMFETRVYGLLFGLHLVFVLVAISGDLPWSGLVERSLLIEAIPRFVVIQLIAQTVAFGGSLAVAREFTGASLALLAGVAMAAVTWFGLMVVARQTAQET